MINLVLIVENPIQCGSFSVNTEITVYGSVAIVDFTTVGVVSETECSLDLGHYDLCMYTVA